MPTFWEKVDRADEDACWNWLAGKSASGYGNFLNHLAHRVAYQLMVGKIPDGMVVMHICDNRSCVNPKHLSIGTHKDNSIDMVKKNRHKDWSGENHGNHKLTDEQARYIKNNFIKGNRWHKGNSQELADMFGVTSELIRKVATGKRWKHIHQISGWKRGNNANTRWTNNNFNNLDTAC